MSQRKLKKIRQMVQETSIKVTEVLDQFGSEENGFWKIIKKNWFYLAIMILGIVVVYFNGMAANFVSDDYATIPNNPKVTDVFDTMGDIFSFVTFSNSVIANLFGTGSPIPYHVYSLLVYIVICVLAFVFVYLLLGKNVAMYSLALFALLPIHVEAVTWISGKPYILATMIMLAGLCSFMLLLKTKNKTYLWWLIAFEFLAFFTDKVRFLSLMLILMGYMFTYWQRHKINIGKFMLIFVGIIIVSLIVISPYIASRVNIVNGGYNSSDSIFYNPFFQYPTSIPKYLQLIFMPTDLTLYHTMYIFPVWLNWSITLTYLISLIYFYFKNKNLFFALAFIFLAAAPSMAPVKVSWLVAERYMFFGSLGFCMFIGIILQDIQSRVKFVAPIILVIFMVSYSVRIYFRNTDWQTNHNLWVNTCQVSPNSHNAWNNIGDDYDKLAQYDNAIKGFTQSTIVKPNYADAFHNRANIFYKMGRLDLARDSYMTALYFSPQLYQTYLSLIQIDLMEKKMDLALEHAQKALQLQPADLTANYILAVVYAQRGEVDKAKGILEAILKIYPNYKQAKDALTAISSGQT